MSKGYHLIHRLSEDVDFRISLKPAAKTLGKDSRRSKLRIFRYQLIDALRNTGFKIPEENIEVLYEGKYMHLQVVYEDSEKISYLKPHIKVECFLGELILPSSSQTIMSLIEWVLKDEIPNAGFPVNCVALDEITAETWVALTRRISNTAIKQRDDDKHLVRHLYDLYHLSISGLLTDDYCHLVSEVIKKDQQQFKHQKSAYVENPVRISEIALDQLYKEKQWQDHWNYFLEQMVYTQSTSKCYFPSVYAPRLVRGVQSTIPGSRGQAAGRWGKEKSRILKLIEYITSKKSALTKLMNNYFCSVEKFLTIFQLSGNMICEILGRVFFISKLQRYQKILSGRKDTWYYLVTLSMLMTPFG